MNFSLTTLLQSVDAFGASFVSKSFQNLSDALTTGSVNVAGLLLTLYVIFWGAGIWNGTATGGPAEHAFRLFRAFLIFTMATNWAEFQTFAYTLLNDTPSALGNALLTSVSQNQTGNSANLTTIDAVQTGLQNMWNSIGNSVTAFVKNLGVLNFGGYFIAGLLLVAGALLVGYAVFLVMLSKVFMWLLLGLAPIFIIMLLFGYTSKYFTGWLNAIVQYFFVQVLVYAFVAFYISITQTYFDKVNQSNASFSTTLTEIAPVLLISIVGFLLLTQITNVAANLAGGIGIQTLSPGRLFSPLTFGARAAGAKMQRVYHDKTGTLSRTERLTARGRARVGAGIDAYQGRPEYQALAKKLLETA